MKKLLCVVLALVLLLSVPACAEGTMTSVTLSNPMVYEGDQVKMDLTGLSIETDIIQVSERFAALLTVFIGQDTFTVTAAVEDGLVKLAASGLKNVYVLTMDELRELLSASGISATGMDMDLAAPQMANIRDIDVLSLVRDLPRMRAQTVKKSETITLLSGKRVYATKHTLSTMEETYLSDIIDTDRLDELLPISGLLGKSWEALFDNDGSPIFMTLESKTYAIDAKTEYMTGSVTVGGGAKTQTVSFVSEKTTEGSAVATNLVLTTNDAAGNIQIETLQDGSSLSLTISNEANGALNTFYYKLCDSAHEIGSGRSLIVGFQTAAAQFALEFFAATDNSRHFTQATLNSGADNMSLWYEGAVTQGDRYSEIGALNLFFNDSRVTVDTAIQGMRISDGALIDLSGLSAVNIADMTAAQTTAATDELMGLLFDLLLAINTSLPDLAEFLNSAL